VQTWLIMSAPRSVTRSGFLSTSSALLGASFLAKFAQAAKAGEVSNGE
jgi:hypothetical protein